MAKGNPFLGTAANSVGDVVMYRREGSQVSRVRVRKIANPKTEAQCEQRAFMSAVVKFYQPLANVLDRSWQGLSRAKSYAKFLKTNVGVVRAAGIYVPKSHGSVALPIQLSNGTLPSIGVEAGSNGAYIEIKRGEETTPAPTTIQAASDLFVGAGYQNDDVVTIILAEGDNGDVSKLHAAQFIINTADDDTPLANVMGKMAFDTNPNHDYLGVTYDGIDGVGIACIISRNVDGKWLRTTSFMDVYAGELQKWTSAEAKAAAIASYKGAAASDNPLVYLDGDELANA